MNNFIKQSISIVAFVFSYTVTAQDVREPNGGEVISLNCARCHNTRTIHEFSLEEWSVVLPHMRERAHLTEAETQAVLRFFQNTWEASRGIGDGFPAEELMNRFGCLSCHSLNGEGGNVAVDLSDVITRRGEEFVRRKLRNPQFNNAATPMPKMNLSDSDIELLIEYLKNI